MALLPRFLIEAELARGDLVLAIDAQVESAEKYYLAWRPSQASYPPAGVPRLARGGGAASLRRTSAQVFSRYCSVKPARSSCASSRAR